MTDARIKRAKIVILLLLCLQVVAASASGFKIDGTMSRIPKVSGFPPTVFRMIVEYQNCNWAITQVSHNSTNRIVLRLSNDGKQIYRVVQVETNGIENSSSDPIDRLPNVSSGQIFRAGFPDRIQSPEMIMLFYAYAASCYLDSHTNGWLSPIKLEPNELDMGDQEVKAYVVRKPDSLRLPKAIWFLHSNGGLTNAFLESSHFTSLGSYSIPSEVTLTRFSLKDQRILIVYDFEIRAIHQLRTNVSFRPDLPGGAFVEDYRFAHGRAWVPPVAHGRLEDGWPSEESAKYKPGYSAVSLNWEKIKKESELRRSARKRSPALVRAILVVTFLSGILTIVIWKWCGRTHRT